MTVDQKYMHRCIQLAKNGLGTTYTNPLVGSVIVHNNKIIGEGWHRKAGTPHAEVHAIRSVSQPELLPKATIYVSLEPCSHFGKTPPCSDLIIEKGIKNVVIGAVDSFAKVSGRGIQKLKNAGCNVTVGVLEQECLDLNKRFFTFHNYKRPYIILKWAESQDGFIAPKMDANFRKPVWITNSQSRQLVHKWRSEEMAILIGTETAIKDNPKLDVRKWIGNSPTRVIIDRQERIPKNSAIFDGSIKTILITAEDSYVNCQISNCTIAPIDFQQPVLQQILEILYQHEIQSIIIEGGSKTLQSFIDSKLWDEARVFKGNINFNQGTKSPDLKTFSSSSSYTLQEDIVTHFIK